MSVFPPGKSDVGVFYPLQTFTREAPLDIQEIPFLISARSRELQEQLVTLATRISSSVQVIRDQDRPTVHLAAVLTNNFMNHLMGVAQSLLQEQGIDHEVLEPLIRETVRKAMQGDPHLSQTGPAQRGDLDTIQEHLRRLAHHPEWAIIYRTLTQSINPEPTPVTDADHWTAPPTPRYKITFMALGERWVIQVEDGPYAQPLPHCSGCSAKWSG